MDINEKDQETKKWVETGTVLLVDDEKAILNIGELMVRTAGFTVLTASCGEEAVRLFRKHSHEIVCVVLDMTMPRKDGEETFHELRSIRPDIRVLISSGYNEQEVSRSFIDEKPFGYIQKPYDKQTLLAKVREVLEE